jgi:hypothetical protein
MQADPIENGINDSLPASKRRKIAITAASMADPNEKHNSAGLSGYGHAPRLNGTQGDWVARNPSTTSRALVLMAIQGFLTDRSSVASARICAAYVAQIAQRSHCGLFTHYRSTSCQ